MMGPTGVGKTEIARRLVSFPGAPFVKVEATKFTEVGYVGQDVESMVRDLMEILALKPRARRGKRPRTQSRRSRRGIAPDGSFAAQFLQVGRFSSTREKLLQQFRLGFLDTREVEMEVTEMGGGRGGYFNHPSAQADGRPGQDVLARRISLAQPPQDEGSRRFQRACAGRSRQAR